MRGSRSEHQLEIRGTAQNNEGRWSGTGAWPASVFASPHARLFACSYRKCVSSPAGSLCRTDRRCPRSSCASSPGSGLAPPSTFPGWPLAIGGLARRGTGDSNGHRGHRSLVAQSRGHSGRRLSLSLTVRLRRVGCGKCVRAFIHPSPPHGPSAMPQSDERRHGPLELGDSRQHT